MRASAARRRYARGSLSDCRTNTAVPDAFSHLAAAADQLDAARKPDEGPRDGLGCIIRMRNDVTHPTRTKRMKWSFYQWLEAHSLACPSLNSPFSPTSVTADRTTPDHGQPMARIHRRCPWTGC